jgi:hypothetical protein
MTYVRTVTQTKTPPIRVFLARKMKAELNPKWFSMRRPELAKLKIENEKVKAERDSLHQAYGAL